MTGCVHKHGYTRDRHVLNTHVLAINGIPLSTRRGPNFGFDFDARVLRKENFAHIMAKIVLSAMVVQCWWVNGKLQPTHRAPHLVLAGSLFSLPYVLAALTGPRFLQAGRKEHGDEDEDEDVEAGGLAGV